METKYTNPNGSEVLIELGEGVKLGTYVTLGNGVMLGTCVKLGNYVKLGNGVTLEKPSDILEGFGAHHWYSYNGRLRFGCLELPLKTWTKERQARECAMRDPSAKKELARVVRTVKVYFGGK
jgi:hypothetical protein